MTFEEAEAIVEGWMPDYRAHPYRDLWDFLRRGVPAVVRAEDGFRPARYFGIDGEKQEHVSCAKCGRMIGAGAYYVVEQESWARLCETCRPMVYTPFDYEDAPGYFNSVTGAEGHIPWRDDQQWRLDQMEGVIEPRRRYW